MGKKTDSLGDRMKVYEIASRHYLTRRIPAVIRIDGKAFHTFTKGFTKPFDNILMTSMQETMKFLCENIQGCVFGYTQSDEITLVLTDYAKITTDAWFGYNVQKMTSISASMATQAFNRIFREQVASYKESVPEFDASVYEHKFDKALFDSRAFSVPLDEVCNCLVWRQQDATRNSIEAVGQAHFSANQLHGKTCNMIQEMLWSNFSINWNDFPVDCKRGASCYRVPTEEVVQIPGREAVTVTRNKWRIDRNIPIFSQDRDFVEKWL